VEFWEFYSSAAHLSACGWGIFLETLADRIWPSSYCPVSDANQLVQGIHYQAGNFRGAISPWQTALTFTKD